MNAPASEGWSVGDLIGGKYEIVRRLADGGMATVFEAENSWTGRRVAIKLLRPEFSANPDAVERFRLEARVMTRLAHPNIAEILDMERVPATGALYIVSEFLRGWDLRALLDHEHALPAIDALALLLPVMGALVSAHAHGVIHRDLKPENIFLLRDRRHGVVPKLIDFGIAKVLGADRSSRVQTRGGVIVGTPEYMAPELIRGGDLADARVDVWSIGVILYEMLAGRLPWFGPAEERPPYEVAVRVVMEPVPPIDSFVREVPAQLIQVLQQALTRDPAGRYPTMRALLADLLDCPLAGRPSLPAARSRRSGEVPVPDDGPSPGAPVTEALGSRLITALGQAPGDVAPAGDHLPPAATAGVSADTVRTAVPPAPVVNTAPSTVPPAGTVVVDPSLPLPAGHRTSTPRDSDDWASERKVRFARTLYEFALRLPGDGTAPGDDPVPIDPAFVVEEAAAGDSSLEGGAGHASAPPATGVLDADRLLEEAEVALRAGEIERALQAARQGFHQVADRPERAGAFRVVQAAARHWRGQFSACERSASRAMRQLPAGSDHWLAAASELAYACGSLGNQEQLSAIADEVAATRGEGPARKAYVVTACRVAMQLYWVGWPERARELLEGAGAPVDPQEATDLEVRAWLHKLAAVQAEHDGDESAALERYCAAQTAFEAAGAVLDACMEQSNVAEACLKMGAYREVRERIDAVLDGCIQRGLFVEAWLRCNLGVALSRLGELEAARTTEQAAVDLCVQQANRRTEGAARVNLARILLRSGDLQAAEQEARTAVQVGATMAPVRASAAAALAVALGRQKRWPEALEHAQLAINLVDAMGGTVDGDAHVRLTYGDVLANCGRAEEARKVFLDARERILARSLKISHPGWRRSFLENVPEHALTLEFASMFAGESAARPPQV